MKSNWHTMPIADVERTLNTNAENGLSMNKARERLKEETKVQGGKRTYLFSCNKALFTKSVLSVCLDPCMILLISVSLLAMLFGGSMQGVLTLAVALTCCAVSVIMSYTAKKRLAAASDYSSPTIRVIRGGDKFYTDGRCAVVGDVILLGAGDLLPCDARIIESSDLVVKELIHTRDGIKNRVLKKDYILRYTKDSKTTAPNALNMLYAGSAILSGNARAIVTETGRDVYLAEFLGDGDLAGVDGKPELLRKLSPILRVIRRISVCAAVLLSLVAFIASKNVPVADSFLLVLSSVALICGEVLELGVNFVCSSYIYKLSLDKKGRSGRTGDLSAIVKSAGALDKLKDTSALVIMGRAGVTRGAYKITEVYTSEGLIEGLTTETAQGRRLLSFVYTYVKTLRCNNRESSDLSKDILDALERHVKASGFDFAALDIYLRSLYFLNDGTRGFACAETANSQFRVALTLDDNVLDYCTLARRGEDEIDYTESDLESTRAFCSSALDKGATCLYVISELEGTATLEGVIALEQPAVDGFEWTLDELDKLGIETYMFFERESDASLVIDLGVAEIYRDKIARASCVSIADATENYGKYCVFAGYTKDDYLAILDKMKADGQRVAVFNTDDANIALTTRADVAITCDYIRYDSARYKDSAYADMPQCGTDKCVRASSMTRLFSGVVLKRAHAEGGGLPSLVNAVKSARMAHLSILFAIKLCLFITASVTAFVLVSIFSGISFAGAFMVLTFGAIASMLPFATFTETDYSQELIRYRKGARRNINSLISALPSVIVRAAISLVTAIVFAMLGYSGVFGDSPSFAAAFAVCMLLVVVAEAISFDVENTKRGEGRRNRWIKLIAAYAFVLLLCGVATQKIFAESVFPSGIGTLEFIIVPVYLLLYICAMLILRAMRQKRK